ncbi:SIR2 family protein [Candidatus Poriferisodalis sp.]|uniref:SIR2 family protein n=1 Tax=Candidatus Poriferisodalis sp. TaxID=3101277 RepID=UPI003B02426C
MQTNYDQSTPLELVAAAARRCLQTVPVIVLGSGASIAHELPSTGDVTEFVRLQSPDPSWSSEELGAWQSLIERLEDSDIEEALARQNLPDSLQDYIVRVVWGFIQERDCSAFNEIISSGLRTPLARLYDFFFSTSEQEVSVVTTNYDRLAEYSADIANRWHYSGFPPGYYRQRHANLPYKISLPRLSGNAPGLKKVNVWKVHGSLDWFFRIDGDVISITAARDIPTGCRPAIITPGLHKYEQTHQEPFRSILSGADSALDTASTYMCVGYGFNDQHIHPRLLSRWRSGEARLLILARHLTSQARAMLDNPRDGQFLALECGVGDINGTHVISNLFDPVSDIEDVNLWDLGAFVENIT